MMLGCRERERLRPHFPVGIENVAAFVYAPAKVVELANEINLLPQVLAIVADPDVPRFWIDRQPPRIAQAIGPGLRHDIIFADEWIFERKAVWLAIGRVFCVCT